MSCGDRHSVYFYHMTLSDVNKTFFVKTKTKTKTLGVKTKTKTSIFFQDQDQDQVFLIKTKTKTFSFKTKTKTLFFVLEAPRDQDFGFEDYITGDAMCQRVVCCLPVLVCPSHWCVVSTWLKISSYFLFGLVASSFLTPCANAQFQTPFIGST